MYDDNSTGGPEKYTKEQFQKMEKERFAAEAKQNAEWDKIRGEIKVNQALSKQKSRDLDAKQDSLFRDETRSNPNMAEMERRAVKDQDAKAAEKAARKAAKSGGSSGNMGTPKLSSRDMLKNNKAGGIIRSSASKRADGCAIRGKTRA
jgi:hypothetical protein